MNTSLIPVCREGKLPRCRAALYLGFLVLLCLAGAGARASVKYVAANQTNSVPDGTSWATAFTTVQQAVNAASDGDTVWVAAGTYSENITLKSGVGLYGGFLGTESGLDQRNCCQNLTILDGRQSGSVVVVVAGATSDTRLDGFVVRNGLAQDGGGINCSTGSPIIANNVVVQNRAGYGGGLYGSGTPTIISNLFQDNFATNYGGAVCYGSFHGLGASILNNRIVGNSVGSSSMTIAFGAGIYCFGLVTIANNIILGNIVPGSAMFGQGGGIYVDYPPSSVTIINNTIAWNQAPSGGGIYCYTNSGPIVNNIIVFCSSGIYGVDGMTLANNCVYGNSGRDFQNVPSPTGANGNISADPQFVSNPNYLDLHLAPASPCRDAGNNSFIQGTWLDAYGGPRLVGSAVDIGADEFDGAMPAFVPPVVRVSPSGDDANDGSSWTRPKRTVQAAADSLMFTGGEVWVGAGVYNQHPALRRFVYLYGGFSGKETNRAQRDWKVNPTVLDGGKQGSVITVTNLLYWAGVDGFVIRNGQAMRGGGICCSVSSPMIVNNIITNNIATNVDANSYAVPLGGGVFCESSTAFVSNNIISFNRSETAGGGLFLSSGGLIANNRIEGNVAVLGKRIFGVSDSGGGGAIYVGGGTPSILNNFFVGNIATNTPDAIYFPIAGGAIFDGGGARIIGNTFLYNLASSSASSFPENGGGIGIYAHGTVVENNLVAFGSSGIQSMNALATTNIHNNCVFGNGTNYVSTPDLTGTNGNISADPLLVAPGDFHLSAGSPCINAGDNSVVSPGAVDMDGQARIAGGRVDIGADEYGSAVPFALTLRSDAGQYMLQLAAEANRTYVFEASTDLANWVAFSTNQATSGQIEVPAPQCDGSSMQLYRAWVRP